MTSTSDERDTRVPYRLGTDHYCVFENDDEFVHMGDMVEMVAEIPPDGKEVVYAGELCSVEYGSDGFITSVSMVDPLNEYDTVFVPCEGVFYKVAD